MARKKRGVFNIPADPPEGPSLIAIIILLIIPEFITKVVGACLGFKRFKNAQTRRRYQLFRRYASAIGEEADVSIRELAARLGMPTQNVVSDLQNMIDEGMIGGSAYIDRSHMQLHINTGEAAEQASKAESPVINVYVSQENRAETVAEAQAKAAAKAAAQPEVEKPKPEKRRTGTDNADFEEKLKEIRQLNDEIENGPVSERIDRIGELTASIFRVVREKPERAEEVRKFMNYYLPTTLKLLKSYSLMEKQSYQGENIVASRKKIEDVLDTLVHAFEQQQDRLFRVEALDVESDISVLETMMTSDGLVEHQGGSLRAGGGH